MLLREISWVRSARKEFLTFPPGVQERGALSLSIAAEGGMPENAKPLQGLGSGVFEIVLNDRGGTFRVVYAVQIGLKLWVVHAFQKKSKTGIKTAQHDINLVRHRLKQLRDEAQ